MRFARSVVPLLLALALGCAGRDARAREEAVIGGRRASEGETYATVGLELGGGLCTGTLIDADLVVTAAHCVTEGGGYVSSPASITVVAGTRNLYAGGERLRVRRVHTHPSYPGWSGDGDVAGLRRSHDIALLELASPARGVTPVPVLAPERAGLLRAETALVVSGFGVSDGPDDGSLYLAEVPLVRSAETELLAGRRGTPDTCNGDSGGPAYVRVEGRLALVGATSRAREDTWVECGAGGIYTLVPAYVDWIESVTGRALPLAESAPEPPDARTPPVDAGSARVDAAVVDAARPPDPIDAAFVPGRDAGHARADAGMRAVPREGLLVGTCAVRGGARPPCVLLGMLELALAGWVTRRSRDPRATRDAGSGA